MNNLISIIISLILYNPLEAGVLLLASWFFKPKTIKRNKFKLEEFVLKTYIISTVLFLIQSLGNKMETSIFYNIFLIVQAIVLVPLVLKIFGYKNEFYYLLMIVFVFNFSLDFVIYFLNLPTLTSVIRSDLIFEFCANIIIRTFQIFILLFCLGVKIMFKKLLKSITKKHVGKEISATIHGYGEPKLSQKLVKEVKESK